MMRLRVKPRGVPRGVLLRVMRIWKRSRLLIRRRQRVGGGGQQARLLLALLLLLRVGRGDGRRRYRRLCRDEDGGHQLVE